MKHISFIISFGLIYAGALAYADLDPQRVRFKQLSVEQGLSQSVVNAICQDSSGYIWIGTEDGLNRYDGYEFTVYRHDNRDSTSISGNHISALVVDPHGVLWIGTAGTGLNRYDPLKNRFIHYIHRDADSTGIGTRIISALYADSHDNLWIVGNGLHQLNTHTGRFTAFRSKSQAKGAITSSYIGDIHEDQTGAVWVATNFGLNKFDPVTGTFQKYYSVASAQGELTSNEINCIHVDQAGRAWFGTSAGLCRYEPESDSFSTFDWENQAYDENYVIDVVEDDSGLFWMLTNKGLAQFDPRMEEYTLFDPEADDQSARKLFKSRAGFVWIIGLDDKGLSLVNPDRQEVQVFHNNPGSVYSLSANTVNTIFEDRTHVLWIGTRGGGVCTFSLYREKFTTIRQEANNPNSLNHNMVAGICQDRQRRLWVATAGGGLNCLNADRQIINVYQNNPDDPASLPINLLSGVAEDSSGFIWVGTTGAGVCRLNPTTDKITCFEGQPGKPGALSSNLITAIYTDRRGVVWIGTNDGLNRYLPETNTFINYRYAPNEKNSLGFGAINAIYEDAVGNFWICTSAYLTRMTPVAQSATDFVFKRFQPNLQDSTQSNPSIVLCAAEDATGALWVGTTGGLCRFDAATETFSTLHLADGLPNETIYGILSDNDGYLWLSTNQGLSKFDPLSRLFHNFDIHDGLQSNEFNVFSYHRSRTGEFFFGGINGLNAFFPDQIMINPQPPLIQFTRFKKFDQNHLLDPQTQPITLSYKENFFSFEFTALDFTNPAKNLYAYKLEGFDTDWIACGTRRYASYANLNGGEYTFRVIACNNDGIWNRDGAAIRLKVIPPFWTRWWFISCMVIFALALIGIVHRIRVEHIQATRHILEELVTERTQELQANTEKLAASYQSVKTLSSIGQKITATLNLEKILTTVYQHVNSLMDATIFGVSLYHTETQEIEYKFFVENGVRVPIMSRVADPQTSFTAWCLKNRQEILINDVSTEYQRYLTVLPPPISGQLCQSLIYIPLVVEDRVIGACTVQSFARNTYTVYHLDILRTLAGYTAIALDNYTAYNHLKDLNRKILEAQQELQSRQEQLIKTEKMASLGELMAGVAHEIKNPLNYVNNFADLSTELLDELKDELEIALKEPSQANPADIGDLLSQISTNMQAVARHGKRAASIIQGMLNYSRQQTGEKMPTDINTLLDEYLKLCYHGFRAKDHSFNATLKCDYDSAIGRIEIAPQDISRVFINLISNSCYSTCEKKKRSGSSYNPEICVSTRALSDMIEIRIYDNGLGISQEAAAKIFEPFFTTKPIGQGTGLGLPISHDIIVNGHGGTIRVDSREDNYAEFVIHIPKTSHSVS